MAVVLATSVSPVCSEQVGALQIRAQLIDGVLLCPLRVYHLSLLEGQYDNQKRTTLYTRVVRLSLAGVRGESPPAGVQNYVHTTISCDISNDSRSCAGLKLFDGARRGKCPNRVSS